MGWGGTTRAGRPGTRAAAARRRGGRSGRAGRGGHPHSPNQGGAGCVEGTCRRRRGGSGCGVGGPVVRAWEPGAGPRGALRRARVVERGCRFQAACARLPPPLIYINDGQHGGRWNGAGKRWCHRGILGWRTAMDIGACTPKYISNVMHMPPNATCDAFLL